MCNRVSLRRNGGALLDAALGVAVADGVPEALDAPHHFLPVLADCVAPPPPRIPSCALDAPRSRLPVVAEAAPAAHDAPRPPLPVLADRVAAPQPRIPLSALDAPRPLLPVLADAACAALDAPRPPLPVLADRVAAPQARIPLCALDTPRPLLPVLADFAAAPPFPHGLDAIRPSNAQPPPTSLHRGYSSTKPTDISKARGSLLEGRMGRETDQSDAYRAERRSRGTVL